MSCRSCRRISRPMCGPVEQGSRDHVVDDVHEPRDRRCQGRRRERCGDPGERRPGRRRHRGQGEGHRPQDRGASITTRRSTPHCAISPPRSARRTPGRRCWCISPTFAGTLQHELDRVTLEAGQDVAKTGDSVQSSKNFVSELTTQHFPWTTFTIVVVLASDCRRRRNANVANSCQTRRQRRAKSARNTACRCAFAPLVASANSHIRITLHSITNL